MGVDLFADSGTCSTARCAANECTHKRACQTAEERTDRTGDHAERSSGFSATECSGGSATSTSDCADSSTGLAGGIASYDAGRVTAGAGKRGGHISVC